MGGGASSSAKAVKSTLDDFPSDTLRTRYQLRNKIQAKALKKYIDKAGISLSVVDKVYKSCKDKAIDVAADFIEKKDYLVVCDMDITNYTVASLNTLGRDESVEFFELFANVHNFCTFDVPRLAAHTFLMANESGSGMLNLDELAALVHNIYGTHVSKGESGLIITSNKSDVQTAKTVMKTMDPGRSGKVTLDAFQHGIKKFTYLIGPAQAAQRALQKKNGGLAFWKAETKRLEKFTKDQNFKSKPGAPPFSLATVFRDLSKMAKATERAEEEGRGGGIDGSTDALEMNGVLASRRRSTSLKGTTKVLAATQAFDHTKKKNLASSSKTLPPLKGGGGGAPIGRNKFQLPPKEGSGSPKSSPGGGSGGKNKWQKAEGCVQKAGGRGKEAEKACRRQNAECRGQKAEGNRQTEDKRRKAEGNSWFMRDSSPEIGEIGHGAKSAWSQIGMVPTSIRQNA